MNVITERSKESKPAVRASLLARYFKLREHGTSVRQEIIAGLTTFTAMAYILAVNPLVLSSAGMDKGALVTATALAAAITTLIMAFMTNYPIALAPGMGLSAFFTFTMCGQYHLPWQSALGLVFWEGLIFLLLTFSGVRRKIVDAIPPNLKAALGCGIGFFIAFIGLRNGGIIVSNPTTSVSLGNLHAPSVLLTCIGVILTMTLVARRVKGAIFLSIVIITIAGIFIPLESGQKITTLPTHLFSLPASLAPTFLKFDLRYPFTHFAVALPLLLTLLFIDLFDNIGTLLGVTRRAGLLDQNGNLPHIDRALSADAAAAMIGATLGTSTTTSYIESAAGVEQGGRTGLSTVVVGLLFLIAPFFSPLILSIPAVATAPALIIVGIFMIQSIAEIDLKNFAVAAPAILTLIVIPLSFSISEGLAFGFLSYCLLMIGLGRARQISSLGYVLAVLFLIHFLFLK